MLWKQLSLQTDEQRIVKIYARNKFKRQSGALGWFLCLAVDQPENALFSPSAEVGRLKNLSIDLYFKFRNLILLITKSPSVGANQSVVCDLGANSLAVYTGLAPSPSSAAWNHIVRKGLKACWRLWSLEWIILGTDELSSRHQSLLLNTMSNEMLSRPGGCT